MAEELYYIQDTRSYVGNSMLWWGPERRGYFCDVREAGVYTKAEADGIRAFRSTDRPWLKSYIDAHVGHHVDMQRVDYDECLAAHTRGALHLQTDRSSRSSWVYIPKKTT